MTKTQVRIISVLLAIVALYIILKYISSTHVIQPLSSYIASTTSAYSTDNSSATTSIETNSSTNLQANTFKAEITSAKLPTTEINLGKNVIHAEVAINDASKEKGLGGRNSMRDDQGMIFPFAVPGDYGFWMKDMKFPIDIVWIDENAKIIGIKSNLATSTYPNLFFPPHQVKYVLELNAGIAEKNNIKVGDKLNFSNFSQ